MRAPLDDRGLAVDIWTLEEGATDRHTILLGLDEDPRMLSDPVLGALRRQLLGEVAQASDAVLDLLGRELARHPDALGAVLIRIAEDADHIELCCGEEVGEQLDIVLGLAGEADDDIGADAGLGSEGTHARNEVEEGRPIAESAHPAQQRTGGVLEGDVEPRHDLLVRHHRLEQCRTDLGRLQIGHPNPLEPVDRRQARQELLHRAQIPEVLAIGRGILADEEDLLDPALGEPASLGHDLIRMPGDEGATKHGDRAERAAAIAATRDFQGRPRAIIQSRPDDGGPGRRGDLAQVPALAHAGYGDARRLVPALARGQRQQPTPVGWHVALGPGAVEDRAQGAGEVGIGIEAQHGVGLGEFGGELLAISLGQAADRDDRLGAARGLQLAGFEQGVDGVLLGLLDEAARVDHGDIGIGGILDQVPTLRREPAGEFFGVDLVACASQRHEGDAAAREIGHGHNSSWAGRTARRGEVRGCLSVSGMPELDIAATLAEHPVIDGHNDLPWALRELVDYDLDALDVTARGDRTHTDLPRLREGGVGGQFWSVFAPGTLAPAEAVTATFEQIDVVHQLIARYGDHLAFADSAEQVRQAWARGKIASLLGAEGGHSIHNSLGTLRMMRALGVRYLTLTHNQNNDWADSATDEPRHGGLSAFGVEVVREMNRIGMLVDLSHVAPSTMHAALDVTSAPPIFSHSSARAICDHPRNVPDDVLERLRAAGGVCMVTFVPRFVSPAQRAWDLAAQEVAASAGIQVNDHSAYEEFSRTYAVDHPAPLATIDDVVAHLEHVREVAGIDHVGIGGDYDGVDRLPEGLRDVTGYPRLLAALAARGWSPAELGKLTSGNILRVLDVADEVVRDLAAAPPGRARLAPPTT